MIEVTKTVYHYPDGTKRIEKVGFRMFSKSALEAKRRRDCKNLGCENITYRYYERGADPIDNE